MPNELQFDGQYGGLGIPASVADSGDVTLSGTVTQALAAFPMVAGQQPSVSRGKLYFELKNLAGGAAVGAIDILGSDTATGGGNQVWLAHIPAPAAAINGTGVSYVVEFFDALAKLTNIVSVAAMIGGGLTAGTARLRVLGGP